MGYVTGHHKGSIMTKFKKATVPISLEMGAFIRKKRIKAGLNQKQLADSLGLKTLQNISNWERGISAPSFEHYVQIAQILGISEREMLNVLTTEQDKLFKMNFKAVKLKLKRSKEK